LSETEMSARVIFIKKQN